MFILLPKNREEGKKNLHHQQQQQRQSGLFAPLPQSGGSYSEGSSSRPRSSPPSRCCCTCPDGPLKTAAPGLTGEALKIPPGHKRGAEVGRHGDDLRRPPLVKAAPLICEGGVILVAAAALGNSRHRVPEVRHQTAALLVT